MKTIGILVSMLLFAFNFNVEALDFSTCEDSTNYSNYYERRQCRAKVCGYDNSPEDCVSYKFLHYAAVASQTGIALMVFIILLISIHIVKEVIEQIFKGLFIFNNVLVCWSFHEN